MTPADYWRSNSTLQHITPPGWVWPEVGLRELLPTLCKHSVFEFGCGYGRLAQLFDPGKYVGYDINHAALTEFCKRNPGYAISRKWDGAYTFLAHTVLLHLPDDEVQSVLDAAKYYPRVVIGEIMGRKWRRGGNPPVFNREPDEYEAMLGRKALELHQVPYLRYPDTFLTMMVFDDD